MKKWKLRNIALLLVTVNAVLIYFLYQEYLAYSRKFNFTSQNSSSSQVIVKDQLGREADGLLKDFEPKKIQSFRDLSLDSIFLIDNRVLKCGKNPKSILYNAYNDRIYTLNLEGMSVSEFDRRTRTLLRTLKFKPTDAKGYDYQKKKWVASKAEKPVEGAFSHGGRYLWISLHNADGVVVWDLKESMSFLTDSSVLSAEVEYVDNEQSEQVKVRYFKTGKTPKVLHRTPSHQYMVVANWHDNSISFIDIKSKKTNEWSLGKTMKIGPIPRGLYASEDSLYVAVMGSKYLKTISLDSLKIGRNIEVGLTPRHLISDKNALYISLSSPEKLVKFELDSIDYPIQTVTTKDDPRTICFGAYEQMIWVGCYADYKIQAFHKNGLKALGNWKTNGKPIGIVSINVNDTLETWVCNYTSSRINVMRHKAVYDTLKNDKSDEFN